eukprot:Ihof_evm2s2 gene=Ihof_evmTU2s2
MRDHPKGISHREMVQNSAGDMLIRDVSNCTQVQFSQFQKRLFSQTEIHDSLHFAYAPSIGPLPLQL